MGDEVTITYESIFELLRREKNREELQKLSATFMQDAASYLKEKEAMVRHAEKRLFSEEEREKAALQLQNIKRMIKELYDRREKKILSMAMMKARMGQALLDTSALLTGERLLYQELQQILGRNRHAVLDPLLQGEIQPSFQSNAQPSSQPPASAEKPKDLKNHPKPVEQVQKPETKTVRFLHAIPKFVGKNLEMYGPFEEEDIASLPAEIAKVLIEKGRAEDFSQPEQEEMEEQPESV